ncbi:hypothetical protein ACFLUJ_09390 [Chloroflexota bacterium]
MKNETRKRLANLISNILSPLLLGPVIILLLSFESTSVTLDALKWALISTALSIVPVLSVVVCLVRNGKLDAVFTNVRMQRTKIYLIAGIFAVVGYVVLTYLKAPPILVATFIVGLSMAIVFMCINLWWKISLHTAFVAASVTVMILLYGWIAAGTVALVPLTSWARIELKYHSLAQTAIGAVLAVLILFVVFYSFALV